MFYDRFVYLCLRHGVSPSRAAQEAGLSKSTVTKWKHDPKACPTGVVLEKLSRYFQLPISDLLADVDTLAISEGVSSGEPSESCVPAPAPRAGVESESELPVAFYDRFLALCRSRRVSPSRAALDAGLSKSTVTKWKNEPTAQPTGNVIGKLTEYFGISVAQLLGEPETAPAVQVSSEDIKFALFGGSEEITDEMYEEVRSFAAFVREREAAKRRKE